ncbi:glycoside hydrolase family 43 protein [Schizophyllum commune]
MISAILTISTFIASAAAYTNPLWDDGKGADPWMFAANDGYYLAYTAGNHVEIRYSPTLTDFHTSDPVVVWEPSGNMGGVWAPEVHFIDGKYYVYVAVTENGDNSGHRMHVLEGDAKDPLQTYRHVGNVSTSDDNWAIDGTVMQYNGTSYFIWSGWTSNDDVQNQHLYIAQMDGPTKLIGERVLLHSPTESWMRSGDSGVNEGPEILVHEGRTFLTYSAAGSWTEDYCIGLMGIDNGADPMKPENWWTLDDRPVFQKSNVTFGVGHASFALDREDAPYIVYHGMSKPDGGWADRTVRAEAFKWNEDGSPNFPAPSALGVELPDSA